MNYNFTDRVRKVLAMAREEAIRLQHDYVGTEHILLGLIREGEGVAAAVLTNLNVDRGRKVQRSPDFQPLEEGDYFLANKLVESGGEGALDQERVVEQLSQDSVVGALSALPHDFRDVVVLVDIGEFSYADAAQILDVPIGTVMSRLHRGRRLLKQRLAEEAA